MIMLILLSDYDHAHTVSDYDHAYINLTDGRSITRETLRTHQMIIIENWVVNELLCIWEVT